MQITRIPAQRAQQKTRVAVYCRVSTKLENQEDSLEMQKQAYLSLIGLRSDWELVEVYADSLSGLSAEKRPQFMRMIRDAQAGKIDRILCKSISRFSRNVAECKKYTDMLRMKNVTVEFEKEHLRTDDPTGSFIFSLMSAIAENESRSISENVRWSCRERLRRGEYNLGNNHILGYDTVDGKLVPNSDAWIVRTIFRQYAEGVSIRSIRKGLADEGVVTKNGTPLSVSGIEYILRNETYRGDRLLQKQAPVDFLTKKPARQKEYESRYLEGDHEAIVSDGTWMAVQEKIRKNKELQSIVGHLGGRPCFLYGKVFCGNCSEPMTRRTVKSTGGRKCKVWVCRGRLKGKAGNGCRMRTVKEGELLAFREHEGKIVVTMEGLAPE